VALFLGHNTTSPALLTRLANAKITMQTSDEPDTRESLPEFTREDRDGLSPSGGPTGIGANASAASPSAVVPLELAEPAMQTAPPDIDKGASRESTSNLKDAPASAESLHSARGIKPSPHATNTTNTSQRTIATSIASDSLQAATPAFNSESIDQDVAPEDASTGVANGLRHSQREESTKRVAKLRSEPLADRIARREFSSLREKQKRAPTGDAVEVEDSSAGPQESAPVHKPKQRHKSTVSF
jgi:hypothetical protein